MKLPINHFKNALRENRAQYGMWLGWASPYTAEAIAATGFDWVVIDGEHVPNDVRSILSQLQAVAPYPAHPVVRPPAGDVTLIKQLLDVGAQTLLIPMIDTAEQAALMVSAVRYPPHGIRGVGSALSRASRWTQVDDYLRLANEQMCVLAQVETTAGMANLASIAATDGLDGVFFGPSDLSASMGLLAQGTHPEVVRAIDEGIRVARANGKAAGVLAPDPKMARHYLEAGATFVAVGVDTVVLVKACRELVAAYKG
jgi:4-hydroxy-2-oxoheptanedioate aldolase